MLSAAFSSRSSTSPQDGQTWVRTDRLLATRCIQRLPSGSTPTTVLAGVLCGNRDHLTPGACCLGLKDGAKRCPASIGDALGEVVVPDHIRNPQIFHIDHVILLQQRECGLVMKVAPLPLHRLMR